VTRPDSLSRRAFLRVIETHGVALACTRMAGAGVLLSACGGLRYARSSLVGNEISMERTEVTVTGVLVDSKEGELPLHVKPTGVDQYRALSTRCMHRGCQVDPSADGFVCPCHGSEYAADGSVRKGPTEMPLVEYRVTVQGTRLVVHLDAPVNRTRPS
jgi:cytochrome b6-f complex iron-sulfur subunit